MAYAIKVKKRAIKALQKIPQPYYKQIKDAIYKLSDNPRPKGCKKLKARDGYRIRVADYRVIYQIKDAVLLVSVINIGHRKDVY